MIDAYDVPAVRAAEEATMSGLPEGELMQRAAAGLADVVDARLDELGLSRVVALVGAGNNGGDALYAVARLPRRGRDVSAVLVTDEAHAEGLDAARAAGVRVFRRTTATTQAEETDAVSAAQLVIDGILGIGGRPGLPAQAESVVDAIPARAYVVAVDLPSGADPAGEQPLSSAVFADETVTFGCAKPVHLLPATEPAVGRLTVVDIGVPFDLEPVLQRLEADDVAALWPVPGPQDDKYRRGVLGVVAGGEQYTGAPVLCVTSAVCAGVGMVRYVGPERPTDLVRSAVPEAVFGVGQVQAWVVGPGLDATDDSPSGRAQRDAAQSALDSDEPCVVDAGALDLLLGARNTPTLLTPHAGELARLLTRLDGDGHAEVRRADIEAAPLRHAVRAAELTGCTVLLKGATTLVVPAPSERSPARSQKNGPAWLATAGSGDVLAGLAGMLLAAGLSPLDAGCMTAFVHGLAGDAANPGGPVRALGVARAIPGVVAHLLAGPGRHPSPSRGRGR